MGRLVAIAAVCAAIAGCGGAEEAAPARHLDPRSDTVVALDLDYDSGNWQQVKRLYARAVQEGGLDFGEFTPPTLDGALGRAGDGDRPVFADDIRPLLGGTLQIGVRTEPAPPLSAGARDVLERLDEGATRDAQDGLRYYDYDGEPLDAPERSRRRRRSRSSASPRPRSRRSTAPRTPTRSNRVLGKLREQGLETKPLEGVEGARRLGEGVAVLDDGTLVAVLADDPDRADALLRERLEAGGDGPEAAGAGRGFVAVRATPAALGAWLDRDELQRALASTAGRALRGAELRLRLDEEAARRRRAWTSTGWPAEELPLPGPGPLALPAGEGVASASADQSLTTVFLARLARELYPESRFVRRVERLEAREGLRFEDEVLRQFSGPSFTVLRPGATARWRSAPARACVTPPRCARCWTASRRTSRASSKGCRGSARPA